MLKGTRTPKLLTGNNTSNQTGAVYYFDNNKNVQNQGLSVGDTLTCEFDWDVSNPTSGTFGLQLNGTNWQKLSQTISITSENKSGHSKFSFVVDAGFLAGIASGINRRADYLPTNSVLTISNVIFTKGSTAIPWMPSASEVKTADWPSYIGQYTDFTQADSTNPSDYTWSLIRGNDGADGQDGKNGTNGKDGDPGKVVSDTEPTTRFKGLTWKYLGTSDLTASDGTVILSGTEYYWSGTKWILNEINSHNINGDNLNVTNGTFTDGKIKSIWNSGVLSGSTEIENSHINMSATDSTSNATNSLDLDIKQGFSMHWTDPTSNQSRSVLLNYGGLVFGKEAFGAGLNFDGTNLSSSMPIQAPNTIVKSTQFTVSGIGIRLDRLMSFVAVTFYGQASSTINNSPTINNLIPVGFRPINPFSIDYMVPGNVANSGYMYFNPDGSIRIMATINSGYYIRGTRLYITNDDYPS
ncbi:hypothetical protein [Lactococcus lactis]|uniref:hypothetical protein n=1 Tax=Lactococcus lactis TaxID=1358 RepID=UPI002E10672F|nr:hypothetical protein VVB72_07200 [Lactococcus lactis subsp. lactis]